MDGMFIWIVMFAGAAIAMLAVFLVASEKELKKKRLEIDELLAKMGDGSTITSVTEPTAMAPAIDSQELEQLRAKNRQLEQDLAEMTNKYNTPTTFNEELEFAQRNVEIAKTNAQLLQTSNGELKTQVEDLKSRLAASESRTTDTALASAANDRQQALEREVIELRAQLATAPAQTGLDGMQLKLADVEAIESSHREEKSRLEARMAALEKQLSAAAAATAEEIKSVREQLAESERIQQLMREERRAIEQELSGLQARVQGAEEQDRQIAALQEPFDKVLKKYSAVETQQREYHEALASFSQLINKSIERPAQAATFNEFQAAAPIVEPRPIPAGNGMYGAAAAAVSPAQMIAAAETAQQPKRRFGLFPLVIALVFGGSLTAIFWGMQGSDTPPTANARPVVEQAKSLAPAVEPAAKPEPIKKEIAEEPAAAAAKEVKAEAKAFKERPQAAKAIEVAKVQQPVAGTYEVVQSSRVFSAPSELAQQMGDIEPGVRVNVVNAKNGWLEIHSKHGRPPGYIRKENARALAQN
jgi:hypothetical protein